MGILEIKIFEAYNLMKLSILETLKVKLGLFNIMARFKIRCLKKVRKIRLQLKTPVTMLRCFEKREMFYKIGYQMHTMHSGKLLDNPRAKDSYF